MDIGVHVGMISWPPVKVLIMGPCPPENVDGSSTQSVFRVFASQSISAWCSEPVLSFGCYESFGSSLAADVVLIRSNSQSSFEFGSLQGST